MTITFAGLGLYSLALFILFMTPGPVWVATAARTLSGGFQAAWPLALGVALGDIFWSLLAIFGVSWIVSLYGDFLEVLRWVAAVMFITMGLMLIRAADKALGSNSSLTKPGRWAGFIAGVVVIMSNPKAILFYMGIMPGFFDLSALTGFDIAAICIASFIVPLVGNIMLSLSIERLKRLLTSPQALRRVNLTSGVMLLALGLLIPFI